MLAARYLGPGRIESIQIPKLEVGDEEALLKVEACGFCGSDLGIVAGVHPRAKAPLTLGHEFCGRIERIHSARTNLKEGDLVTAYPLISCGRCHVCRTGAAHVCRELRLYGFDVDGAMAEYVRLPVNSLLRLPNDMSPLVGAVVEPLAVAVHGVSLAPTETASTAVVMGAGPSAWHWQPDSAWTLSPRVQNSNRLLKRRLRAMVWTWYLNARASRARRKT